MKILVLCACILACASFGTAKNLRTELRTAISHQSREEVDACYAEAGLTRLTLIKEKDIINEVHLQPEMQDRRTRSGCFIECCLKKANMMDESGTFNTEQIHLEITKMLNGLSFEGKAHEIANNCIQEAKDQTGHCEKGFKVLESLSIALHDELGHESHDDE